MSMERLTSKRDWIEAEKGLTHEYGYSHIWRRLKQIEDILGDTYDLDRVRELIAADKDGRCVVLPCKVGEKVYDIASGYVTEKTVISIPFMLSKSVNYLCLHAINKRDAATTIEPASIGETVFLTREAAEAALAKVVQ